MIRFNEHFVAPNEVEHVATCFAADGNIGPDGLWTKRASKWLRSRHRDAAVLVTGSCTHALEISAIVAELAPGDEVVLPSFTFTSTANAFALRGANLRFADICPQTFSMELPQLEAALTPRTKVVVAMHYGGVSRDIDKIAELCRTRNILLVEDNAHGLFAEHDGRPLGTFGALSTLSFHVTKNVSVGVAGALVVNDKCLLEPAKMVRDRGTNRDAFLRGDVDKYTWQSLGSAYAPADYVSAVLVAQLEASSDIQLRRKEIYEAYRSRLSSHEKAGRVGLQTIPRHCAHPAHVFGVQLRSKEQRQQVRLHMRSRDIQCVSHYEPLHLAAMAGDQSALPVTESLAASWLRLPLHPGLSAGDVARVCDELDIALRAS